MGYTKEAEIIWNKICDKFSKDRNKTMITRTMAYEMINEALAQNLKQPDVSGNEANPKENKKESEVAVCDHPQTARTYLQGRMICMQCSRVIY